MNKFLWILLFFAAQLALAQSKPKYTISGYITEVGSKELMPFVNVVQVSTQKGTTSNSYGFYSITLEQDTVELYFSFIGYTMKKVKLYLDKNTNLDVQLETEGKQLDEVVIEAGAPKQSDESQMSVVEIPVEQIKQIPALLGEKDVIKAIQLMPGVQKGSEGSSGLYVRGGGPDQNLILLDDAPVYNASHLFGFFSVFNGDALKSIELYKGGFPARFGGRLSSVLDLQMKDGNKEKIKGEAGIGLIASRFTLEGPILKDKCSFIVSARRTYIDALIYPFLPKESKFGYFFYDMNAKVNYVVGKKDRLFLSGYFGKDKFYAGYKISKDDKEKVFLKWGNATATLRWNHLFNEKLFSNTSFIFTNYDLQIGYDYLHKPDEFTLRYTSRITDYGVKMNFDYFPHPDHFVRFGGQSTFHHFTPSALVVKGTDTDEQVQKKDALESLESAVFIEDDWKLSPRWKINGGIRITHFATQKVNYLNPEPRLSMRYKLTDDISLKASYAMMNQYLHLLSNTGIGLPTDLWVPATARVKPQRSQQGAFGAVKDFKEKNWTITVEGYYKHSTNVIGYRDGASFLLVDDLASNGETITWEDNVTQGQGWSYGGEFLIQKKVGKFTGWVGYTLSWTQLQFDELNFGKKYYARYDRRHDISVVGIYKINKRITLSGTWVFGSGNAISMPLQSYSVTTHTPAEGGTYNSSPVFNVQDYGAKNSFRMAPYHRMDVGIQFHKKLKRCERIFELSFYNLYNRKNPFYYYIGYSPTQNKNVLRQVSLFPILPSVSWTYKF
ncbi:MAG TPA: TonB-dependent receptor [Bacteroidia bacterium]